MVAGVALSVIGFLIYLMCVSHPQPAATATSTNGYLFVATATATAYQGEIDSLLYRLDALDGGKVKNWLCSNMVTGANIVYESGYNFVQTVGGETPKQLGYSDCTLLK